MPSQIPEPVILQGPKGTPPRAAVMGCGGTGCNILAEGELGAVETRIALGSEPDTMSSLKVQARITADGRRLEKDALAAPKSVRVVGTELEGHISQKLEGADMTFILAGLGGLTGGWGAVVGARSACIARSFSVCVVSAPFSVEGGSRKERASTQLNVLKQHAGCVLVIPNDMILTEAPGIPINRAFRVMNSVIASPVNLMLKSMGTEDIGMVRKYIGSGRIMAMDSAEWDRENAEFAVIERLQKSKWLDIKNMKPKSAILFVEGLSLYDDLVELGTSFSRVLGEGSQVLVASAGDRKSGLSVTAVVGY